MLKESKKQIKDMLQMMERMENHYTKTQVGLLNEATRLSYPNLESFFLKEKIKNGDFVSIGYIQMYPTMALYPNDDLHGQMSAFSTDFDDANSRSAEHFKQFMDKSQNSEWDNPTGRAYRGVRSFGNKIYPYILKLTTYTVNWQNKDSYTKAVKNQYDSLKNIQDTVPSGLEDKYYPNLHKYDDETPQERIERIKQSKRYRFRGVLGDNGIASYVTGDEENPENLKFYYRTNPDDPNSSVEYNKTAIKHILSGDGLKRQKPLYFGVYEDGSIDPIPKSLGKLLKGDNQVANNAEKLKQITDEVEREWAEKFFNAEAERIIRDKIFLLTNVAYLACRPKNSDSVYWRNPNPLFLLEKTKNKEKITYSFNINQNDLDNILEKFAREAADELHAYENPNI